MVASPPRSQTVLLVEPWWAGSHRAWAEGLATHSRHRYEVLAGRRAGWKATLDQGAGELARRVGPKPDVVVASSMLDLPVFLAEAGLDDVPAVLYMHENQLTYDRARPDRERGAVNWKSVRRADRVAFNSDFHRTDFFAALPLLGVDPATADAARAASVVLPVGIEVDHFAGADLRDNGPPVIVWNHRWETDKDPAGFLAALEAMSSQPWRLVLLGEGAGAGRFRLELERLADRVVHCGHAPRSSYAAWLQRSDLVVSTARQEFFGVAVVEAMAAGVVPVVPNRLAYPEVLGRQLAECLYEDGALTDALAAAVKDERRTARLRAVARTSAGRFDWSSVVARYDALIDSMV